MNMFSFGSQLLKIRLLFGAMIVKNHPDAPKYGFLIRSDGSILVGDPSTYTDDEVRYWFEQWIEMRARGVFDKKIDDPSASSSSSVFVPASEESKDGSKTKESQQDTTDEIKDKQAPLVPKKKGKKAKKNKGRR